MMKNNLFIVFITIILFAPVSSTANENLRPEIYIENSSYDAGKVMAGTVIDHTFTVYNRGEETLNIKAVRPG
ncbi:hypothetical protein ACFL6W_05515 [Thermodesulfobacteriota bacterium]